MTLDDTASPAAVAKVQTDARNGVAEASRLLATLAGAGVGMPQSWPAALDHLAEAARRGSASAQGQLAALGSLDDEQSVDRWGALAASVRIGDWMAPCEKRVLNPSPRVVGISGFLPTAACEWLIDLARGRTEQARVYAPDGAAAVQADARSNSAMEFGWLNCDVVVLLTRARIAATIGVPVGALENSQVLHYETGQQFTRHVDYLDPALPDVAERGQRIVTFLIYLNAEFDGGETDFPRLGVRYKGGLGDALYFANLDRRRRRRSPNSPRRPAADARREVAVLTVGQEPRAGLSHAALSGPIKVSLAMKPDRVSPASLARVSSLRNTRRGSVMLRARCDRRATRDQHSLLRLTIRHAWGHREHAPTTKESGSDRQRRAWRRSKPRRLPPRPLGPPPAYRPRKKPREGPARSHRRLWSHRRFRSGLDIARSLQSACLRMASTSPRPRSFLGCGTTTWPGRSRWWNT